ESELDAPGSATADEDLESAGHSIILDEEAAEPEGEGKRKRKRVSKGKSSQSAKAKSAVAPATLDEQDDDADDDDIDDIDDIDADGDDDGEDDGRGPEIVMPSADALRANKKKAPLRAGELALRKVDAPKPADELAPKREGAAAVTYLKEDYELPPIELFAHPDGVEKEIDKEFIKQQADAIVETLAQFKVKGKVTRIHPGPVITRYEFKPEAGTKISKIQN